MRSGVGSGWVLGASGATVLPSVAGGALDDAGAALDDAAAPDEAGAALDDAAALGVVGGSPDPSMNLPGMTSVGAPGSEE
jgi:hypothetical protein